MSDTPDQIEDTISATIQKAFDNGWAGGDLLGFEVVRSDAEVYTVRLVVSNRLEEDIYISWDKLMFHIPFIKAIWKDREINPRIDYKKPGPDAYEGKNLKRYLHDEAGMMDTTGGLSSWIKPIPNWQRQLQQLVIAEDRIEYLRLHALPQPSG